MKKKLVVSGTVLSLSLAGAIALPAGNASLAPREEALHVLNRLGFGPRPGDVERVIGGTARSRSSEATALSPQPRRSLPTR